MYKTSELLLLLLKRRKLRVGWKQVASSTLLRWGKHPKERCCPQTGHGSAELPLSTSASIPKAQNGQRHNLDMLFKLSEKHKAKSELTLHVPDFVFLPTKPPSPNPLCFGNWESKKKKKISLEKIHFLSSNIPTYKPENVKAYNNK